jgi:hypothetical protein
VTETTCPNCQSDEVVGSNVTNFAEAYYCRNCDSPFNPAKWPCPWCESDEPVNRNPFDDPCEYYCYDCDLAFNRLGASFDSADIEYGTLTEGFDSSTKRLSLDVKEGTKEFPRVFKFTLQNTGEEPVPVQGRLPIAVQSWITDDEWWTIHGNPKGFTPEERSKLLPGETLEWDLLISRSGMRGPGFDLNQRFASGKYRVIYWGVPTTDQALATCIQAELTL